MFTSMIKKIIIINIDQIIQGNYFTLYFYKFFLYFFSQGLAERFRDFEYSQIPGPGQYGRKGFAEEAYEKATKYNSVVNDPSSIICYRKKKDEVKIDNIEENSNENENEV